MIEKLLNKACVRIILKCDGTDVSLGSGTLVRGKNGFFVVTAHHCIFGDDNAYPQIKPGEIIVEKQAAFNAPFETIEVLEITASDLENDWALLSVNFEDQDNAHPEIAASTNFKRDDQVTFTGFQAINKTESRSFKSTVQNAISSGEFRITLAERDTFKAGSDHAKGLSGSGAFLLDGERLVLLGILKSVKGEEALNDDIKCCSLEEIAGLIGIDLCKEVVDPSVDDFGIKSFGKIIITDKRNLMEKILAVNADYSEIKMKRLRRHLALGKAEMKVISEREMSAIKYRLFDKCQDVLEDFVEENAGTLLTEEQIEDLIQKFTESAIEIIKIKSTMYRYPILDADLMRKVVLDLVNECYLSFDKEGLYEREAE